MSNFVGKSVFRIESLIYRATIDIFEKSLIYRATIDIFEKSLLYSKLQLIYSKNYLCTKRKKMSHSQKS
ncbi:hypothetical protein CN279_27760 [Bacillus anthracis]|nr:hypothetical protein CN279_27760 [Bacillus anthracis]